VVRAESPTPAKNTSPVLRVCGKGTKVVLIPLPPAVGRAIDRAAGARKTLGRHPNYILAASVASGT
jgi:hypothetical protein